MGSFVTAKYKSKALPPAPQRKQCQQFFSTCAAKLRLRRDFDPCTGHGPRSCGPQRVVGVKPTRSSTCVSEICRRKSTKSIPDIVHLQQQEQGRGTRTFVVLLSEKTLHVEGFAFAQHVVHGATQTRRQDAERLLLAVLLLVPGLPDFHRGKVTHQQTHRFGKRPLQM